MDKVILYLKVIHKISEKKTVTADLTGIKARYVRGRNTQPKNVWLKMSDL